MATEVLSAEEVQVADLADQLIAQHPPASTPAIAFLGAQFDLGLAWVHFPVGHGGLGLSPKFQKIVNEKIARAGGPNSYARNPIGYGMCGPTVVEWGTDEQKRKYLRPLFTGEEIWCQLFSEPGSGSDFAGLSAKGVKDGDEWIVNGQKVWSSWAHLTDWGILVVRTDPTVPKHKGLTFFVVDMKTTGIDVRPIRQISGASDFNETFLTDVRIPDSQRIGAVGEGWACCMTVLMGERLGSGAHTSAVEPLIDYAMTTPDGRGGNALDNGAVRQSLAEALAEEQAEKYFQARLRTMVSRGENPGALAGMVKLAYARRLQKTSGLGMELRGVASIASDDAETADLQYDYIWSTVMRIAGGADEVLRNQIAERVLGMPGDVRMDKDVPFEQLR